jgi:hypothetical protein
LTAKHIHARCSTSVIFRLHKDHFLSFSKQLMRLFLNNSFSLRQDSEVLCSQCSSPEAVGAHRPHHRIYTTEYKQNHVLDVVSKHWRPQSTGSTPTFHPFYTLASSRQHNPQFPETEFRSDRNPIRMHRCHISTHHQTNRRIRGKLGWCRNEGERNTDS